MHGLLRFLKVVFIMGSDYLPPFTIMIHRKICQNDNHRSLLLLSQLVSMSNDVRKICRQLLRPAFIQDWIESSDEYGVFQKLRLFVIFLVFFNFYVNFAAGTCNLFTHSRRCLTSTSSTNHCFQNRSAPMISAERKSSALLTCIGDR